MDKPDVGVVIEAAGGLVWRRGIDGKQLLIIHRTRYGGEWTLPKGKKEIGESWQVTALREVAEETGCKRLRLEDFAGVISYPVDDSLKIVLFWNMVSDDECRFEPNNEVNEIKWLPPRQALKLMRYPKERALVTDVSCLINRKPVILRRLRKIFKSSSHRRLDTAIGPFEIELKSLIEARVRENKSTFPWAEYSTRMINCANQALEFGEIELGWRYLLQAELLSLHLLTDKGLKDKAQATLNESEEKLGESWRKKTVQHFLGKNGELNKDADNVNHVYTARKILQERHSNTYIKVNTARFQLEILAIIGFLLLPLAVFTLPTVKDSVEMTNGSLVFSVVILGAMGGVISSLFSVARVRVRAKIPDQLLNS